MGRGDLARAHERRVQQQRQIQCDIQATKNFYNEAKYHDLITKTIERATKTGERASAAAFQRAAEEAEKAATARAVEEKARLKAEAAKEAEEERRRKDEETERQMRIRQAIIDASPELRELKAKIAAAKVAQEQDSQLREAFIAAEKEEEYEVAYAVEAAKARAAQMKEEELAEKAQQEAALAARLALQAQLQERNALRAAARDEVMKERAAIEEMVAQVRREDEARRAADMQHRRDLFASGAAFLELQKELRDIQRAAEAEEDRKIQEYLRVRRENEQRIAKQKAQKRAAIDEDFEKARMAAEAEAARIEEEEALLDMLRAEMDARRAQQAAAEAAARQASQRQELLAAKELAMKYKAQKAAMEAEWEKYFRNKLMERLAEEDKVYRMNAVARRVAIADHLREAERCVAYKRRLDQAMKEEEEAQRAQEAAKESARKAIVEEERHRLLQEAKEALTSHLPRGVVQTLEDLEEILHRKS